MPSQTYYPETKYKSRLTVGPGAADTTLYVEALPQLSSGILIINKDSDTDYEIITYSGTAGAGTDASPYSLTGVVRGLLSTGTTLTAGTGKAHGKVEIGCADVHFFSALLKLHLDSIQFMPQVAITAALPTSSNTHYDIRYVQADNAFYYWSLAATSGATSDWVALVTSSFTTAATETVAGKAEAATPTNVTARVTTDDSGALLFVQPRYTSHDFVGAGEAGYVVALDATGKIDNNFIESSPLATAISDVSATATEVNRLSGISANVTAANLNTLTAGATSNADSLHTHATLGVLSYTAYESITADNALALLPIETKWYLQLTDVVVKIGDTNAHRRRAVKYIPTATATLTDWDFRAAEQVNGATALGNLLITIETDNAGSPSGVALTNATATISQVTQRTWNTTMATRTATFAGSVSVVAGTTYWVVYSCSATDVTNYLKFGANDSYVGHYLTFTSKVYDLDAATWGGSSTTSIPFGWSHTTAVPFGFAVCPTDADFGGRTWPFVGFAQSSVSAQAVVAVETDLANLTGLVADGNSYYISATAGAITQTKPGNLYDGNVASYAIGEALSSTQFKIRKGEKMYFGTLAPTGSATTAHTLIPWFPMKALDITGSYLGSATQACSFSHGIYDGTSDYATYFLNDDGGAEVAVNTTAASFGDGTGSHANRWTGTGGSNTNIGLTYTVTKAAGTPNDYVILFTLRG